MKSNIIAHDSTIKNQPINNNSRRFEHRPASSSSSSIIGGIDSSDRWKTSNQLPIDSKSGKNSYKRQSASGNETYQFGITPVERLRKQLFERGSYGIIGLSKKFKSMDDDGSNSLSRQEFQKALLEYGLDFTPPEVVELFNLFDKDRSGTIGYEEFIQAIRGKLNQRRKDLVFLAFQKIDKDGSGVVDVQDLIGVYDASKHPDVISKKRQPEEVLVEFLEGFDVGGEVDGKVTLSEFENYYSNISASIDDDDYFELMIRNAWHISGGEGWCANTSNRRVLVTDSYGNQRVEEIKNDLGLKGDDRTGMINRLRTQGIDSTNIELYSGGENGIGGKMNPPRSNSNKRGSNQPSSFSHQTISSTSYIPSTGYLSQGNEVKLNRPGSAGYQNLSKNVANKLNPPKNISANELVLSNNPSLQLLRNQLLARGVNGISGLSRCFRRMDFDGSKSLSYDEFSRALTESGLIIPEPDKRKLFVFFDRDRSGSIDYNEFLIGLRGSLNNRRKSLVGLAFQQFDKDKNGVVDVQDLIGVYDASKHPDVISKKRTSGQVLREFLEGFDVGGEVDGKVTLSEFENYYSNISASIDDDDYFELMIRNAWHISGGEGWCANTSNRRVLVTDSYGNQRVEEIKNDLGLKGDDRTGMINRLRTQGIDVSNIDLNGDIDDDSQTFPNSKSNSRQFSGRNTNNRNDSSNFQNSINSSSSSDRTTPVRRPSSSHANITRSNNQSNIPPSPPLQRQQQQYNSSENQTVRGGKKDIYPGMVLPNGLVVKDIRSSTTGTPKSNSRLTQNQNDSDRNERMMFIPSGEKREQLKEMKHSAYRLYSQKNYREAEVLYMKCLQFLLESNGNQINDPEYVKGVDNVNKCREKLGLKRMTIGTSDYQDNEEEYEDW